MEEGNFLQEGGSLAFGPLLVAYWVSGCIDGFRSGTCGKALASLIRLRSCCALQKSTCSSTHCVCFGAPYVDTVLERPGLDARAQVRLSSVLSDICTNVATRSTRYPVRVHHHNWHP